MAAPDWWEWVERISWVVAIGAAVAGSVAWMYARRRSDTRPGAHLEAERTSVEVPADQPGGAVHGRTTIRGREALVKRVAGRTGAGGVWVLHGLGGSGKTTVAWAVARRAQEQGVRVWWVSAADAARLDAGMHQVTLHAAARLGVRPAEVDRAWQSAEAAALLVWKFLRAYPARWLLVVDNADDPELLATNGALADGRGWLQPIRHRRGRVVVTSRDGNPEHFGSWCRLERVDVLPPEAGAEVLLDHAGPDAGTRGDAVALAHRLGGLPLALRLAGSYLAAAGRTRLQGDVTTTAEYLRALDDRRTTRDRSRNHPLVDDVRMVWRRSLDHLDQRGIAGSEYLLRLLSVFADSPLPVVALRPDVLEQDQAAPLGREKLRRLVGALTDLSLIDIIRLEPSIPAITVHPLVRDVSRADLTGPDHEFLRVAADLLLDTVRRERALHDTEDPRSWPMWEALTPHVLAVVREEPAAAPVAVAVGRSLRARGLYAAAADALQIVIHVADDPDTTRTARHHLGRVLRDQGRYAEAEACFRAVREESERTAGPAHRETIQARHELARVLHATGDLAAAEREAAAVHNISARVLGEEEQLTLAARYEWGRVLFSLERFGEAGAHFRAVHRVEARLLGEEHPDTLNARHQAARVALRTGQAASAVRELRAVLDIRRRVQGLRHPTTVATHYNYAQALHAAGEPDAGLAELAGVIRLSDTIMGPEHPGTLSARHDYAIQLAEVGRAAAAREILREVYAVRARVLGAGHPDSLRTAEVLDRLHSIGDAK
jgi:tetratricopeptide (TPR) repeat protein